MTSKARNSGSSANCIYAGGIGPDSEQIKKIYGLDVEGLANGIKSYYKEKTEKKT